MNVGVFNPGGAGRNYFADSTFLIIDDFQGMRAMLSTLVRNCGANAKMIDSAANGAEAINLLSKRRYDVVMCDFNLGAGKNGQQILEEARSRNLVGPSACWIMVTAEKTTETVIGTAEVQPDAYLVKPITEAVLTGRLQKIKAKKAVFVDIDAAMTAKDYLKAIRLCEERAQSDRANALDLLRTKCDLLLLSSQIDKAKQSFEAILSSRDVPWAQLGLAKTHFQNGDYERAVELLEQLIDRNRSYVEAYDWLAKAYLALEEKDKSLMTLDRAVALSPQSHKRQLMVGQVSLQIGKLEGAEKAFRKSMALSEHSALKSADTFLGLAKTLGAKADPGEAVKVLEQMTKTFDSPEDRVRAKAVEGMVYQQNGDPERARQAAQQLSGMLDDRLLRIDSDTTQEMAQLLLANGEQDKALSLLEAEVMNNPDDRDLLNSVQEVFKRAGLDERGAELIARSSSYATSLMNEGVLLLKEEKYEAAIVSLRATRDKMPKNVRVLFNLVHVMVKHMQKSGADRALLREGRKCLMEAHQLAPAAPRFAQLLAALDELAQSPAAGDPDL